MVEPFSVQIIRFISSRKRNMPSKNTSVISARVKDETALKFTQIAENRGITVSKLLDEIAEKIEEETLFEKGVTHDGYAVSEISEEEFQENLRYKKLRFDRLIAAFEKRGYPDEAIRKAVETMIQTVLDSPKYNPRRTRYDESC